MIATTKQNSGRFALGNAGGPGRPPLAKERAYLETLIGVCTQQDWKEICLRAIKDAKAGDSRARDWLTKYLVGEPPVVAEVKHEHLHGHGHLHAHLKIDGGEMTPETMDAIINARAALDAMRKSARDNAG